MKIKDLMQYYSFRKYLMDFLKWLGVFALAIMLLFTMGLVKSADRDVITMFVWLICGLAFIPYMLYSIYRVVTDARGIKTAKPIKAEVKNWGSGYMRGSGYVEVIIDGNTYSTPSYFSHEEAKSLVGRQISCCIINDGLFIFSIDEENF
ncbi:MAG: hypothetical protein J6L92_00015 [Clostridia bacterium]|nr:hypothetical protein [Clostridia bacterium]